MAHSRAVTVTSTDVPSEQNPWASGGETCTGDENKQRSIMSTKKEKEKEKEKGEEAAIDEYEEGQGEREGRERREK